MNAPEVGDAVISAIGDGYDFILVNFANADMVGHTGVLSAAIEAVETVDRCLRRVVDAVTAAGGSLLITADHGNCEQMTDANGGPHTAHTTNLVHVVYVADDADTKTVRDGILADVAPTLLAMLGIALLGVEGLRRKCTARKV